MSIQRRQLSTITVLSLLLFLTATRSAHAYLDPGSGSYFLQMALGGIFAGLLGLKMFWSRIKLLLLQLVNRGRHSRQASSKPHQPAP